MSCATQDYYNTIKEHRQKKTIILKVQGPKIDQVSTIK